MGIDFTDLRSIRAKEEPKENPFEVEGEKRTNSILGRRIEELEEARKVYKEYQSNIKMTEELRVDILKTTNQDPRITKDLVMKAIKIVSLLCHEPTFYDQVEKRVTE